MTPMNDSEFADAVMALADGIEPFQPVSRYDPDGDCFEFFSMPDSFYAERVDDLVTVYYSQETNEVIGSQIKGVSAFCKATLEQFPGLVIEIQDGKIRLKHLFRARLWSDKGELGKVRVLKYQKLIEMAEQTEAEATVCVV